jgi:hypothetical protein
MQQWQPATPVEIPLGDKPFATAYYSLGREICQDMYLENAQSENSKASYYLLKIPGLRRYGSIPTTNDGACRMLDTMSNYRTFQVNGNKFYEINADGTKTLRGQLNSFNGVVKWADNGNLLMLVDGVNGWIFRYTDNNFTVISDPYFPGVGAGTVPPTWVTYNDTYFIVNLPNTNQFYYSYTYYVSQASDLTQTPYDPLVQTGYWNPINSAQKIGYADNIAAVINCNDYIWALGYNTTELFYDTGNSNGQLYARYQGAVLNIGCKAPYSVAVYENNIFFLGSDKSGTLGVFSNQGMNPQRISTRGIEQLIESMADWSDCIAYCYAQSGHSFYVMQFPTANQTLVYDTITNAWHQRTKLIASTGAYVRWDGCFATNNFDMLLMGDMSTSAVYQLDPTYQQNDNPMDTGVNYIRCVKTPPLNFVNGQWVIYHKVQIICNQGSGTATNTAAGVGINPQVQLAWSDDGGLTWSNELSSPIGQQGNYGTRTMFWALGRGRNRQFRIAMSDPVPFILVKMIVWASPAD